ncbi:hypothetical protein FZEAL_3953 [Fusarium zealandicum]|uniref:Uncharacterized protein n=1 Tax=Fusarium zealandicum TaxID=1053134 RepID=A0A8H4XM26_9HYPO|nr:hypothetical protein FZEAL_3953 [Fusarium zealandicum]
MVHNPAIIEPPQGWRRQPRASWPELRHPAPATIIAFAIILLVVSLFVSILCQLLERRVAQRRGWFLTTTCPPTPSPSGSRRSKKKHRRDEPKVRPVSDFEIEARQLLFADTALLGERVPLRDPNARGSLYNTFQLPGTHASRLKYSQSTMELNGGKPLEGVNEKKEAKKAKTIHWHGVNRLNTAWAWMS